MKKLVIIALSFPWLAFGAEVAYRCKAQGNAARVDSFDITVDHEKNDVSGTIKGSPKKGEGHQNYGIGRTRGARLRLVPGTLKAAGAGSEFTLTWTQGQGYTVDFEVSQDSATITIREPKEVLTIEQLSCGTPE